MRVVPGSSRTEIAGMIGEEVKIRLQALPSDGRANAALCEFVAASVGVAKGAVRIVSGHSSRRKILEIGPGGDLSRLVPGA